MIERGKTTTVTKPKSPEPRRGGMGTLDAIEEEADDAKLCSSFGNFFVSPKTWSQRCRVETGGRSTVQSNLSGKSL